MQIFEFGDTWLGQQKCSLSFSVEFTGKHGWKTTYKLKVQVKRYQHFIRRTTCMPSKKISF